MIDRALEQWLVVSARCWTEVEQGFEWIHNIDEGFDLLIVVVHTGFRIKLMSWYGDVMPKVELDV